MSLLIDLPVWGVLGGSLYLAWRRWRRLRWVVDTPTARIRSAPQGFVELKGRARPMDGEPVIAPLSGLPCAWYRYRCEERRNNRWWPLDRGRSEALFWLEDDTGRCAVDPEGAEVIKGPWEVWYDTTGRSAGQDQAWWRQLSVASSLTDGGARERYSEQRIIPGESLYVLGLFTTVSGSATPPDVDRETALLLEEWKRDPRRMALFDRNGNGRLDPAEWEAARRAARRQVERQLGRQTLEPEVHLLRRPRQRDRPLVISTFSDVELARRYRRQVAGWLAGALGAAGFLLDLWPP